jgi:hypothetical protein
MPPRCSPVTGCRWRTRASPASCSSQPGQRCALGNGHHCVVHAVPPVLELCAGLWLIDAASGAAVARSHWRVMQQLSRKCAGWLLPGGARQAGLRAQQRRLRLLECEGTCDVSSSLCSADLGELCHPASMNLSDTRSRNLLIPEASASGLLGCVSHFGYRVLCRVRCMCLASWCAAA